ncbi:MAG: MFS transporter [Elusimicrobia bacterium]|nr:MFS transporter [Elusimicrobiota bacterium]MDY6039905.1 MFS transporter [Elusimicrobiaceae bacterium]
MQASTRKGMIVVALANGLLLFGYGLSLPFFTIYLISQRHLSPAMAGLVIALAGLSRCVSSAISGELADAFGRKKVMMWGLFSQILAMFCLGLCIEFQAQVGWMLICYFLTTFFGAFFRPASNAWVTDNTTPKERVEAFGILRIGLNIGWALGPAAGGFLVRYSYSLAFFFTALLYAATILYLGRLIEDKHVPCKSRKPNFVSTLLALKDSRLAKICFYVVLITAVNSQLVVGLSIHCKQYLHMPENYIGWFFTINGLVVVFLQYWATKIMAKIRLSAAMLIGCLLYAIGFGSVGFFDTFALIAVGVFLAGVGELIVSPGEQTLVSNIASRETRGRYLGMLMVFYNLGSALGFFGAGLLGDYVAPFYLPGPWLIVGAVAVLAGLGFWSMRRSLTPEEDGKTNVPVPIKKDTITLN